MPTSFHEWVGFVASILTLWQWSGLATAGVLATALGRLVFLRKQGLRTVILLREVYIHMIQNAPTGPLNSAGHTQRLNQITLPAHHSCHHRLDEEYVRNLLASFGRDSSASAARL